MRELTVNEIESVSGGFLANLGMGVAGATSAMGLYSLGGGINGVLSGSGFVNAGIAGFVYGATGFSPAGLIAGTAVGSAAQSALEDTDS